MAFFSRLQAGADFSGRAYPGRIYDLMLTVGDRR